MLTPKERELDSLHVH